MIQAAGLRLVESWWPSFLRELTRVGSGRSAILFPSCFWLCSALRLLGRLLGRAGLLFLIWTVQEMTNMDHLELESPCFEGVLEREREMVRLEL